MDLYVLVRPCERSALADKWVQTGFILAITDMLVGFFLAQQDDFSHLM